jgi:hypothetical protein
MTLTPGNLPKCPSRSLAVYAVLRGTERAEAMRRTVDSGDVGSTMTAMSMEFVLGQGLVT